ncbi:MAG: 4'-phosphopantetheinyl transferase family protein [Caulobacteraceae bacterium]
MEWEDARLATREVAERFFSQTERMLLDALAPERRIQAFFNAWTRKEAFVKALGLGLSFPLDAFDVSLSPDEPATLLAGPRGWTLRACEPVAGLHVALAIRRRDGP